MVECVINKVDHVSINVSVEGRYWTVEITSDYSNNAINSWNANSFTAFLEHISKHFIEFAHLALFSSLDGRTFFSTVSFMGCQKWLWSCSNVHLTWPVVSILECGINNLVLFRWCPFNPSVNDNHSVFFLDSKTSAQSLIRFRYPLPSSYLWAPPFFSNLQHERSFVQGL